MLDNNSAVTQKHSVYSFKMPTFSHTASLLEKHPVVKHRTFHTFWVNLGIQRSEQGVGGVGSELIHFNSKVHWQMRYRSYSYSRYSMKNNISDDIFHHQHCEIWVTNQFDTWTYILFYVWIYMGKDFYIFIDNYMVNKLVNSRCQLEVCNLPDMSGIDCPLTEVIHKTFH